MPFPAALLGFLERYLAHYRPTLCQPPANPGGAGRQGQPGSCLWVSRRRCGMSPEAIYGCIVKWSTQRLGRRLTPHLFRDCAATSIAIEDPDHVHITRDVLGHSSLRTSEMHYNHARALEAARRHQDGILARRRSARRKHGGSHGDRDGHGG